MEKQFFITKHIIFPCDVLLLYGPVGTHYAYVEGNMLLLSFLLRSLTLLLLPWQGYTSPSAPTTKHPPALLVIDPFIDFLHDPLLQLCEERGIQVIDAVSGYTNAILTNVGDTLPRNVVPEGLDWDDIRVWVKFINTEHCEISCVLSESDVGISAAERIVQACSLKGNKFSPQLRSKYEVNEICRSAGLKVVSQLLTDDWGKASEFIDSLLPVTPSGSDEVEDAVNRNRNNQKGLELIRRCVVKPYRGVASDGVSLCDTMEHARSCFEKLKGANTYGGGINEKVLIQEFADGTEYAMDTVSMDGQVKVLALWRYSKVSRMCNACVSIWIAIIPNCAICSYSDTG